MWNFHTGDYINQAQHTYRADPGGWLIVARPIGIDAVNDIKPGTDGWVLDLTTAFEWSQWRRDACAVVGCPGVRAGRRRSYRSEVGTGAFWPSVVGCAEQTGCRGLPSQSRSRFPFTRSRSSRFQ